MAHRFLGCHFREATVLGFLLHDFTGKDVCEPNLGSTFGFWLHFDFCVGLGVVLDFCHLFRSGFAATFGSANFACHFGLIEGFGCHFGFVEDFGVGCHFGFGDGLGCHFGFVVGFGCHLGLVTLTLTTGFLKAFVFCSGFFVHFGLAVADKSFFVDGLDFHCVCFGCHFASNWAIKSKNKNLSSFMVVSNVHIF